MLKAPVYNENLKITIHKLDYRRDLHVTETTGEERRNEILEQGKWAGTQSRTSHPVSPRQTSCGWDESP